MILQKDLIAESGLTRSTAETVLKRLRRQGEIVAVKDPLNHNRISYSTDDAAKIREHFAETARRIQRQKGGPPEGGGKEQESQKPEPEKVRKEADKETEPEGGPPSTRDRSVRDFVEQPGPEVKAESAKGTDKKKEEKAVPFYKRPIVYVGAGLLLLAGLVWLYQRRRQRQKHQQVKSDEQTETVAAKAPPRPSLADQYRIM